MALDRLAFLETYAVDESVIMGVIMVTDSDTKPLEFRVTSPIKPTNFQKILYGNVLKEHILVELVALPLLNAINENLDLILVNDPLFLGANTKQDTRIVRVFSESDSSNSQGESSKINAFNPENKPVFVETSKEYSDELPGMIEVIEKIADNRDLIEPFERLKLACEQIHLKKTKE